MAREGRAGAEHFQGFHWAGQEGQVKVFSGHPITGEGVHVNFLGEGWRGVSKLDRHFVYSYHLYFHLPSGTLRLLK